MQEFFQVLDYVGYISNDPLFCGQRLYAFDKQYPFLSLAAVDASQQKMEIKLATN